MKNSVHKKCLIIFVILINCGFAFAQNIRIVGVVPRTDTGKCYQLQIGAFRLAANARTTAEILSKNGFVPLYEKKDNLIRVFVAANANEVCFAIDRLKRAGFREVIIREYAGTIESFTKIPDTVPLPNPAPVPDPAPEKIPGSAPNEVPVINTGEPNHDLMHIF